MDTASSKFQKLLEAVDGDVKRLDNVIRYSSIPTIVKESVSTHSYWVSLYSVLIHRILRPRNTTLIAPILITALIHDLPECVTGDVVRTFKYSSESLKREIDEAEAGIIKNFAKPIFDLYALRDDLVGQEERQYIKDVVKAADFMSLHQYMLREIRRGNDEIIPFYKRMEMDLKNMSKSSSELSDLYKAMLKMAKKVRTHS